ncbi:MAG TPA: hypothetical protein VHH34_12080, partial [Pseudonocardiaceae bacterium]|nr:hypothetical protein [Pseudonocardiaceae bacterium]
MTDPPSDWARPEQPLPATAQGGQPPPGTVPPSAPKPGVIALRPLNLGDVLDGAISYMRANPAVTLGLAAVVMTLTQLVHVPAQHLYFDGLEQWEQAGAPASGTAVAGALGSGMAATLLGVVVNFVAITLLTGMLIVVLSRAVLGWPTSLQEAWRTTRPRLLGLLGLSLVTMLLLVAALVAGVVPIGLAALLGAPPGLVVIVGLVSLPAGIGLMIYLWAALALAPPSYMLEHVGVLAALSRSRGLVRSAFWRVFGILLLGTVIAAVISAIIGVPFAVAGTVIDGGFSTAAVTAPTSLTALLV